MIAELKSKWYDLIGNYSNDQCFIALLWEDLSKHYQSKSRHYHNFYHIKDMLLQAEQFKSEINSFDVLVLAIWYHDVIYKSTKKNNEEKSALYAKKSLENFDLDKTKIEKVQNLIISTKKHQIVLDENEDNAYLLDFDLSILGTDWDTYKDYTTQIRKEYKIYPDFMYKPGRKKVLQHFLERETLYFTDTYKLQLEKQARKNITKELKLL